MSECMKQIMGQLTVIKLYAALKDRLRRKRKKILTFLKISVKLGDKRQENGASLCL